MCALVGFVVFVFSFVAHYKEHDVLNKIGGISIFMFYEFVCFKV